MTANTYPTADTVRLGARGHQCRYCGHTVREDGVGYRHTVTGQYRCDPSARARHETGLSNSMVRS